MLLALVAANDDSPPAPQQPKPPEKTEEPLLKASDVTVSGLDLPTIMKQLASATALKKTQDPPLIVWLIDNTSFVVQTRCLEALAQCLMGTFGKSGKYRFAVVRFGQKSEVVLKPTKSAGDAARAIQTLGLKPEDTYKDYCAAVRFCAEQFKEGLEKKHIILFTLQNNDIESADDMQSDLEPTLALLKENQITLHAISGGSILSDPNGHRIGPNGSWYAGDSGDRELVKPHSHFQSTMVQHYGYNTCVPSGWGYYGLSRLAAYTEGKYYLFAPPMEFTSYCAAHGCQPCDKDHLKGMGCLTAYAKLSAALAPLLTSRADVLERSKADPVYRLLQDHQAWWNQGRQDGRPVVASPHLPFDLKTIFSDGPKVSPKVLEILDKKIATCDEMIATLSEGLKREAPNVKQARFVAHVESLLAWLSVERYNLRQYRHYLNGLQRPVDWETATIAVRQECLCHFGAYVVYRREGTKTDVAKEIQGLVVAAIQKRQVEVYGEAQGTAELTDLLTGVADLLGKNRMTPWELVIRRIPIVVQFQIVVPPKPGPSTPVPRPTQPTPARPNDLETQRPPPAGLPIPTQLPPTTPPAGGPPPSILPTGGK